MEHYYIIQGNEFFGFYIDSKINYHKDDLEKACEDFNKLKNEDESFCIAMYYVNKEGKETTIEMHTRF